MKGRRVTSTSCCDISFVPNNQTTPEETVDRMVNLGRALSDPIRVRMLGLMAEGRDCCNLSDLGVPENSDDQEDGICVCEFMSYYGLQQSKVSYHLGKLKDAGLITETKRGKWNFYSIDKEKVKGIIEELAAQFGGL